MIPFPLEALHVGVGGIINEKCMRISTYLLQANILAAWKDVRETHSLKSQAQVGALISIAVALRNTPGLFYILLRRLLQLYH